MSPYASRLRPHGDPGRPLARDDADDVRQVLAALNRPLLDADPCQLGKAVLSSLRRLAAHPAASGDLIEREFTLSRPVHLIRDDARIGDLAGGQHAGHDGRHWPGCRERPPASDRAISVGRALRTRPCEAPLEAATGRLRRRPCGDGSYVARGIASDQLRICRRAAKQPGAAQRLAGDKRPARCGRGVLVIAIFPVCIVIPIAAVQGSSLGGGFRFRRVGRRNRPRTGCVRFVPLLRARSCNVLHRNARSRRASFRGTCGIRSDPVIVAAGHPSPPRGVYLEG